MYKVAIITASDKGAKGGREDKSAKVIEDFLKNLVSDNLGFKLVSYQILSDDLEGLSQALIDLTDNKKVDLIFTTGGTGLSPRDNTPEATLKVAHRLVPGISEAMRMKSLQYTDRAMLSRGVSVTRNQTLIINLPGSPKAVLECLEVLKSALFHAMEILTGRGGECGN